jgi:hypothetical protein
MFACVVVGMLVFSILEWHIHGILDAIVLEYVEEYPNG